MCMYVVGSELALSIRHWFTTRRSRALKRRLSGIDEVDEAVEVVVLGSDEVVVLGLVVVVVAVGGVGVVAVVVVAPAVVEFAGVVGEP